MVEILFPQSFFSSLKILCICGLTVQVKAILVNVFGGIVDCATIANGITSACQEMELKIPLVVRLEGKSVLTA